MQKGTFSYKLIAFFSGMSGLTAYSAILGVLLLCGLGVPIPEDITLISAGLLVFLGKISFAGAITVGLVGVMLGDGFLFFIGRIYGRKVFTWPIVRRIATPKRIAKAELRIKNNARFICFMARFLPGLRAAIFLTAGTMGIRPSIFLLLDGLAALLSVPFWIWFGWKFGENLDYLLELAEKIQLYLIAAVLLAIVIYFWRRHRRAKQLNT